MPRSATELKAVVDRIRYLRLSKAIREHRNPALDEDRRVLLSRLRTLGFSETLVTASDQIERRAASAATDMDVKSVMELIRTFFEEVVEEPCRRIEAKVGTPAPSGPKISHYAPYRPYLQTSGIVGLEESELLQKLYNFLSNQGAHTLGTAPEQLRAAHAMVIELCMLIAGRVQMYLAT